MIVVDANLLIYAHNDQSAFHALALDWLNAALREESTVGIPVQSAAAFLRVLTDRRLRDHAIPVGEALDIVQGWMTSPNVRFLHASERHWQILDRLLRRHNITGKNISDAQLAAIAIEHGAKLVSADGDFRRFPELLFENPLDQA